MSAARAPFTLPDVTLWRLWWKIAPQEGEDACWAWLGARNSAGYPVVKLAGEVVLVSRLVCALAHGWFRKGEVAMHSCDHPWCVNPGHIAPGTQSRNIKDSWHRTRKKSKPRTFAEAA